MLESCEKEILELKNLYNASLIENSSAAERFALFTDEKNEALAKLEDYKNLVEQLEKERNNTEYSGDALKKLNAKLKAEQERFEKEKTALREENIQLKLQLNEKEQLYLDSLKQISMLKEFNDSNKEVYNTDTTKDEEVHTTDKRSELENIVETSINEPLPENEKTEPETDEIFSDLEISNTVVAEDNSEAGTEPIVMGEIPEIIQILGQANELQSDNLKLINGINQETEEKLYALGINSYEQLSRLSDENINHKLCKALHLKEKTIETDQWESQAKQLLIKQKINNLTRDMNLNKLFKK